MSCDHSMFKASVSVTRLTAEEGGPVTGYTADLLIHCTLCGQPFQFVGMPGGVSHAGPRCSFDGTEARLPLTPFDEASFRLAQLPTEGMA